MIIVMIVRDGLMACDEMVQCMNFIFILTKKNIGKQKTYSVHV
jgi:hypothetical protein